jgi:hypothetical protein
VYKSASSRDKFGQSTEVNNWKGGRYNLFCDMKHCSSISHGFTEDSHQRSESQSPVFVPRFEDWTFQILKLISTLQIVTYGPPSSDGLTNFCYDSGIGFIFKPSLYYT